MRRIVGLGLLALMLPSGAVGQERAPNYGQCMAAYLRWDSSLEEETAHRLTGGSQFDADGKTLRGRSEELLKTLVERVKGLPDDDKARFRTFVRIRKRVAERSVLATFDVMRTITQEAKGADEEARDSLIQELRAVNAAQNAEELRGFGLGDLLEAMR
jgi:hypothetical protein